MSKTDFVFIDIPLELLCNILSYVNDTNLFAISHIHSKFHSAHRQLMAQNLSNKHLKHMAALLALRGSHSNSIRIIENFLDSPRAVNLLRSGMPLALQYEVLLRVPKQILDSQPEHRLFLNMCLQANALLDYYSHFYSSLPLLIQRDGVNHSHFVKEYNDYQHANSHLCWHRLTPGNMAYAALTANASVRDKIVHDFAVRLKNEYDYDCKTLYAIPHLKPFYTNTQIDMVWEYVCRILCDEFNFAPDVAIVVNCIRSKLNDKHIAQLNQKLTQLTQSRFQSNQIAAFRAFRYIGHLLPIPNQMVLIVLFINSLNPNARTNVVERFGFYQAFIQCLSKQQYAALLSQEQVSILFNSTLEEINANHSIGDSTFAHFAHMAAHLPLKWIQAELSTLCNHLQSQTNTVASMSLLAALYAFLPSAQSKIVVKHITCHLCHDIHYRMNTLSYLSALYRILQYDTNALSPLFTNAYNKFALPFNKGDIFRLTQNLLQIAKVDHEYDGTMEKCLQMVLLLKDQLDKTVTNNMIQLVLDKTKSSQSNITKAMNILSDHLPLLSPSQLMLFTTYYEVKLFSHSYDSTNRVRWLLKIKDSIGLNAFDAVCKQLQSNFDPPKRNGVTKETQYAILHTLCSVYSYLDTHLKNTLLLLLGTFIRNEYKISNQLLECIHCLPPEQSAHLRKMVLLPLAEAGRSLTMDIQHASWYYTGVDDTQYSKNKTLTFAYSNNPANNPDIADDPLVTLAFSKMNINP